MCSSVNRTVAWLSVNFDFHSFFVDFVYDIECACINTMQRIGHTPIVLESMQSVQAMPCVCASTNKNPIYEFGGYLFTLKLKTCSRSCVLLFGEKK